MAAIGLTGQITVAEWTFDSNLNATTIAAHITASAIDFTFAPAAGVRTSDCIPGADCDTVLAAVFGSAVDLPAIFGGC